MTKRTRTLTALGLAAAALAVPATAGAASPTVKLTHYKMDIDVRLDYQRVAKFSVPGQSQFSQVDLSTQLLGTMDVTFANGRIQPTQQGVAFGHSDGTWYAEYHGLSYNGARSCESETASRDWGTPQVGEPFLTPLGQPHIVLRLAAGSDIAWGDCKGDARMGGGPVFDLTDSSKELGDGPLDVDFEMPFDAVGNGKIIQAIEGPPSGSASFCPLKDEPDTASCTYGWKGTVTFTKTSETTISDGDAPGGPEGAPQAGGGTGPKASGKPPASKPKPRASTSAKATAKGSTVSFDADCPLGCAGIAHLRFGSGSKASAAKGAPAIRFRVKAGAKRRVVLRLSRPMARRLRRAGRASLDVTLTPPGGPAVKRSLKVTSKR